MFCPKPAEDSPNWMGPRAVTNIVPVRRTILFVLLVLGFGVESGVAAAALAAGVPERGAYIYTFELEKLLPTIHALYVCGKGHLT